MKPLARNLRTSALAVLLTAGAALPLAHAQPAQVAVPPGAKPMTAYEVFTVFRNRTWLWGETGASFFDPEGRRFKAWSNAEGDTIYAEGRWILTDTGRLCLQGDWHTAEGVVPAMSCFSHMRSGDSIFQKREPDGGWYVLTTLEADEEEERVEALVAGDLVSAKLETVKATAQQ